VTLASCEVGPLLLLMLLLLPCVAAAATAATGISRAILFGESLLASRAAVSANATLPSRNAVGECNALNCHVCGGD